MNNATLHPLVNVLTAFRTHADLLSSIYDQRIIPAADIPDDARVELERYCIIRCLDGDCRLTSEIRRMFRDGIEGMKDAADD